MNSSNRQNNTLIYALMIYIALFVIYFVSSPLAFADTSSSNNVLNIRGDNVLANEICYELKAAVANDKVKIVVTPLVNNRYAVSISGTCDSDADANEVIETFNNKIDKLKNEQNINFELVDTKGISGPPPSKLPHIQTAKSLKDLAQSYLDPNEATASIVVSSEPDKHYKLKLIGHPSSLVKWNEIYSQEKEITKKLVDTLSNKKEVIDIDDSELIITPELYITQAFKPVTEATDGISISIYHRTLKDTENEIHYVVAINGNVDTLQTIHKIERIAVTAIEKVKNASTEIKSNFDNEFLKHKMNDLQKLKNMRVTALILDGLLLKDDPGKTARWPISRLGNAGFADLTSGTSPVDSTVTMLKTIFGDKAASRDAQSIAISGNLRDIRRMKSLLALEDSAHPQVRLTFWSIQSSGDMKQNTSKLASIRTDINETEWRVQNLSGVLQEALVKSMIINNVENDPFFYRFYAQMFGILPWEAYIELHNLLEAVNCSNNIDSNSIKTDPDGKKIDPNKIKIRSYTTDEALILLGIVRNRYATQAALRYAGERYRFKCALDLCTDLQKIAPFIGQFCAIDEPKVDLTKNITYGDLDKAAKKTKLITDKILISLNNQFDTVTFNDDNLKSFYRIRLNAQNDEQNNKMFARLIDTYTPEYTLQTRSTINDFLKSLNDYYDLVRALGIYTFPQGRYMRKPENENTWVDFDTKEQKNNQQKYYNIHYYVDEDGIAISEDPEDTANYLDHAPENLVSMSDKVDTLLASTIDALESDVENIYLSPLLERIRNIDGNKQVTNGIALGARTTITVSDNQEASQISNMYSYIQSSAPKPYTVDELLGASEASDTSSGLAKLVAGLPLTQRLLVDAAFHSDIEHNFAQVAPGISVRATPSTSLSGSTADLKIVSCFGVPAVTPDANPKPDVYEVAHPSGIANDTVTTRIEVDGFRLFNISSENIHTSTPQGNDGVPIFSRLPLLGSLFQWNKGNKEVNHQSLLLVNAVIVPKSLRLANFYGCVAARNHAEDPSGEEYDPLLTLSSNKNKQ